MDAESGFPEASLSTGPIIVASPISCIARDVGCQHDCGLHALPLKSSPFWTSFLNTLGNYKSAIAQNISPLELSVTIGPFPHLGQRSHKEISLTNSNTPPKSRQCFSLIFMFYSPIYALS